MRNRAGLETQDRILDATRRLLAEGGLERTTVKAICDAADIRAGSFYNLFESKEQVVLTVVRQAIRAVEPAADGGVDELVEAYIRFLATEHELARVYLVVAVTGSLTDRTIGRRVLRHHQERIARFTAAFLHDRPGLAEEEASARAEALLAALNGYALHSLLDPSFDFAGHARRLLTMEPA